MEGIIAVDELGVAFAAPVPHSAGSNGPVANVYLLRKRKERRTVQIIEAWI
jgi:hypothetical protein